MSTNFPKNPRTLLFYTFRLQHVARLNASCSNVVHHNLLQLEIETTFRDRQHLHDKKKKILCGSWKQVVVMLILM